MGRRKCPETEHSQLDAVETLCKCPLCEQLHYRTLNWIGRGTPRKFCLDCEHNRQGTFESYEHREVYSYSGQRERTFQVSELPLIPTFNGRMRFGNAR